MNIRNKPALRDKLAAEYSLGTLKGAARRRFEGWLHGDADLRRLTAQWQARLMPMGEFATEAKPPQRVWRAIEQRLRLKPAMASVAPWRKWLSDSLDFWRNLGLVSTAMASVLVAVLVFKSLAPITPEIAYVATLTDEKSQAVMLVTADTAHRNMAVKFVLPQAVALDKSLELWAVPKSGAPRSLGLVGERQVATVKLSDHATGPDVALLAVTLEPKGGSPNPNGPTGPILYKGPWIKI